MKAVLALWQVLLVVGVGQKATAAKVPLGDPNASLGRPERGAQSWTPPPHFPSSQVAGNPVNYWFKTGVVDEDRGFMQGRAETKKGDQVVGSYQYSDGHVKVKVVYMADQHGYRVIKEERVTMKPSTTAFDVAFKGTKEQSHSPKFRPTPSVTKDDSYNFQVHQSPVSSDASQGPELGTFDLKLRTNHGAGSYSHQGLSINPGKSTKYQINHESSSFPGPKAQDDDVFNHSLERQNDVRPRPVKVSTKPKPPSKTAASGKPKNRKPNIYTDSLAIFIKDPSNGKPLFHPQEMMAPKKRNPRRLKPFSG